MSLAPHGGPEGWTLADLDDLDDLPEDGLRDELVDGGHDVGLVVEVVGPGSRRTDRYAKPGDCAEAGIPLSWRLETEPTLGLLAFVVQGGRYVEAARLAGCGAAPTPWGVVDVRTVDEP